MWPQCFDLQGPRGLEQRDVRNLNLGDLKKGPNGGVSPTPQKNIDKNKIRKRMLIVMEVIFFFYFYYYYYYHHHHHHHQ
jgi:hypothetical protein